MTLSDRGIEFLSEFVGYLAKKLESANLHEELNANFQREFINIK